MLEGLYAAAAGLEAQQTQLNALSSDVANENTPGYQSVQVGFRDLLYTTDNDAPSTAIVGAGASASPLGYDQTQGAVETTNNPLDVALSGPGYLEVRQPSGTLGLTRNGTLQLNAAGQLTTSVGMPLSPPITVPRGTQPAQVKISTDGTVSVGGQVLGKLSIVDVTAPDKLLPQGNSVFAATAASGPPRVVPTTTVTQGALTQSNVNLSADLTELMTTERTYSMASKAIQFQAQLGQIASTIK